jgi:hypothetical protein
MKKSLAVPDGVRVDFDIDQMSINASDRNGDSMGANQMEPI